MILNIHDLLRPLSRRLAAGAAALVATLALALPAAADPAMWVVRDKDSTIYLLGTVHVLRPDTVWRTPAIDKALTDSSELWIEVDTDDAAAMQGLIVKYGLDPANPLRDKLDPGQRARFETVVRSFGVDPVTMDTYRPWLAGLQITLGPIVKAGFDPLSGVEAKLKAAARDAGKPIRTLETLEQQIRFFADLPRDTEIAFLLSSLDGVEEGPAILDAMVAAWSAGDSETLGDLMIDEMAVSYPGLYRALLVDRNKAWAEQIDTLLDGEGVILIAVGAGHLVGPDSVQAQLAARGIAAERLLD